MTSQNEKGSAEAATSPSRGSNNPAKDMSMNERNNTDAGGETLDEKEEREIAFDLIALNLFAIVELAGDICMNGFTFALRADETGELEYRISRSEGNQLIALLNYARDAAEAKLAGAL